MRAVQAENCKNALALGKRCDKLATVCGPHYSDSEDCTGCCSGEDREFHLGGLAVWAS
jgi:hypothetical protein